MATKELKFVARMKDMVSKHLKRMQGGMKRLGAVASSLGGILGGAFAVGSIVRLGASVLKTAGDFQESMNRVKAVTRATEEDFKRLEKTARTLGATTQFSAQEAAEGMNFLAMAGFKTNQIITAMPSVLKLAAAAQMDLGTTADIVSNILTGFGMDAEQTGFMTNGLAVAATSANTTVAEMGEAMKFAAPVASAMGMSFSQAAAAVALMSDAGIKAGMAGTSLRNIMTRLTGATGPAEEAVKRLGLNLRDADNEMKKMPDIISEFARAQERAGNNTDFVNDVMTIFGDRAGPAMLAMISRGEEGFNELANSIENDTEALDEMYRTMTQGLNAEVKNMKSAWQELQISIGEAGGTEAATEIVKTTTQSLRDMGDAVKESGSFWTTLKDTIVGTLAEVEETALSLPGVALGAIQSVADGILELMGLGENASDATFGPIVRAAEALPELFRRAFEFLTSGKVWETIKSKANAAWESIHNSVVMIFSRIVQGLTVVSDGIANAFISVWETISNAANRVFASITGAGTKMHSGLSGIFNTIVVFAINTFAKISLAWSKTIEAIITYLATEWPEIIDIIGYSLIIIEELWKRMVQAAIDAYDWILDTWSDLGDWFEELLTPIFEFAVSIWEQISQAASDAVDAIIDAWGGFTDSAGNLWNDILTSIEEVLNNILNAVEGTWNEIVMAVEGPLAELKTNIEGTLNEIFTWMQTKWTELKTMTITAWTELKDAATKIVDNWMTGMKNAVDIGLTAVWKTVKDKLDKIRDYFKKKADDIQTGGSIIPDMIKGIGKEFEKLDYLMVAKSAEQLEQLSLGYGKAGVDVAAIMKGIVDNAEATATGLSIIPEAVQAMRSNVAAQRFAEKTQAVTGDKGEKAAARASKFQTKATQEQVRQWQQLNKLVMDARLENLSDYEAAIAKENILYAEQQLSFDEHIAALQLSEEQATAWRAEIDEAHRLRLNEIAQNNLDHWDKIIADNEAATDLINTQYEDFWQGATDIIASALSDMALGVKGGTKNMLAAFAKLIGGMASQWGEYFVLEGIAKIAASGWPPNPKALAVGGAEVAAGIALKALGGYLGGLGAGAETGAGAGRGGGVGAGVAPGAGGAEAIPGRDTAEQRFREGRIIIDLEGLTEEDIITNIPAYTATIIREINRASERDEEITFRTPTEET